MTQESDLRNESEKPRRHTFSWTALPRSSLAILLLVLGVLCSGVSCIIPKFADILRDLYEKHPLPALTQFVIGHASLCFWLSILLPIAGIACFWRSKSRSHAIVTSAIVATVLILMCTTILVTIWMALAAVIELEGNVPK